jgi:hypothetical protein
MIFFPGDKVVYQGSKFPELRNKLGEVCAQVKNSPGTVVVDFGDNSYVMSNRVLDRFKPSKEAGVKELDIQVRRKKYDEDD